MLRASRSTWLRRPYPNKMPTPSTLPPYAELSPCSQANFSRPAIAPLLPCVDPEPPPLVLSIFAPRCVPRPPTSLFSFSVQFTDFSGSSSTEEGHPRSFASVVFSQRRGRCSTSPLPWERRELIVCRHGFCPQLSCAVIGLAFALVSFLTFYIHH